MQSKTLYFNPTLFRKNLTRFWPLWGGASLLGVLAPLALLLGLIDTGFRTSIAPFEATEALYDVLACIVPEISLFYAILCALAVWNYLYNARSVSLYHSLPITRNGLFCTNFLSGMAMMLIPYAVTGGLTILVFAAAGRFEPVGILVTILGVLGDSFFFFAFATFTAFITGNPFACAAFYLIFNFFFAAAELLVDVLMSEFYFGVNLNYEGVLTVLSPVIHLIDQLHAVGEREEVITADGWHNTVYTSMRLENGWMIAVYALAGAAFLALAWMLYKRRRSESAGDVVAVGWMKPVFRYGVALCCGLAGGEVLYQILFETFESGSTASVVPMAVCMAVAGVIGYYIASMLLAKSIKVFRGGTWKGAAGTLAVSALICFVIAADPAGIVSWVPPVNEVDSVDIRLQGQMDSGVDASITDPDSIQKILDLHSAIVSEKNLLDRPAGYYRWIRITYWDKDGKGHTRDYSIHCSPKTESNALRLAEELACDPVIQEENIFGYVKEGGDIVSSRLVGGYIEYVYNTRTQAMESHDLTREQAQTLEDAIRRDIAAGHFGKTVFLSDYNQFMDAAYRGELQLHYNLISRGPRDHIDDPTYSDSVSISLSVHCTETLQALEDLGIFDETHKFLTRRMYDTLRDKGIVDTGSSYPDEFYYEDTHQDAIVYPEDVYVEAAGAEVYG